MTNELARQMLSLEHNLISPTNPKSHALELALSALEKQIPEPAIVISEPHSVVDGRTGEDAGTELEDWVLCPCCKNIVGYWDDKWFLDNFCSNCGQAVKEPEVEKE